jgi:hypothetical protein
MKKTFGFLVLALSTLLTACASSGASSQPKPTQPDPGESWPQGALPSDPSRPANATVVPTAEFASR